ncbi:MAG: hypothetical protein FWB98_00105 [Defluviitaleaceae bacterium]|nr:hypothetical protein [Defluviitaleaceae bacterium]
MELAIATIVVAVIGFLGGIAGSAFKVWLNKKQSTHESNLTKKNYVSKVRFDAEFEIFRNLNRVFFSLRRDVFNLYPKDLNWEPQDEALLKKYNKEKYDNAFDANILAQDELNGISAFIGEDMYSLFDSIVKLSSHQITAFEIEHGHSEGIKDVDLVGKPRERTVELEKKHDELIIKIREYLKSLEVKQ